MSNVANAAKKSFEDQMQYFENARIENDLHTVWSIYEVSDITSNAAIKVAGKTIVYESICPNASMEDIEADLWDGGKRYSKMYSATVNGTTWLSMWKAANKVIIQSGTHHSYIEDFTMNSDGTIELTTGS